MLFLTYIYFLFLLGTHASHTELESIVMVRSDYEVYIFMGLNFEEKDDDFNKFVILLHSVSLQVHREDKWMWKVDSSSRYTVRSAYNSITSQGTVENPETIPSVWHKDVPLKVLLFMWRMLRDRLPTKNNLHRCRVLDFDDQFCVGGCGSAETSTHLFLHCVHFSLV